MKALSPAPIPQTRSVRKDSIGTREQEPETMAHSAAIHRGKRILLVDDDAGVRGSIGDVLISESYFVIPASDGQQAIEVAASTHIDLVLLDLNMPVKNGWDTFERLTAEHPLVPVIIVTARPNQIFTALGAGVGALLEKPMEIDTLLLTIKRLLAESANQRLARLAGRATEFYYAAAQRRDLDSSGNEEPVVGGEGG